MFRRRLLVLLAAASLTASCGGGGGGSSPAAPIGLGGTPTPAPSTAPQGTARASFTITVPSASTSAKKRGTKAVPANAAFIQFTLLKTNGTGGNVGVAGALNPLSPGSPGCTAVTGGEQCIIPVAAPVGDDIYTATIYAADGTTSLGSGAVNIVVAANTANAAQLTLGGTLSYVLLETDNVVGQQLYFNLNGEEVTTTPLQALVSPLANVAYPDGSESGTVPTSSRIYVIGIDQYGNQIIAPDTFSTPVTLTVSDASPVVLDAKKRRPRDDGPPQIAGFLTVIYAYSTTGVTSATTSTTDTTIQIQSPADRITFTPYSLDSSNFFNITASVPGSTATSPPNTNPLQFFVLDGMCQPGYTAGAGAPYDCEQPAGSPEPSSSPSATPQPYELAFANNNGGGDAQVSYTSLTGEFTFELPSITDPSVVSVGFIDQLGNTPTLNVAPATTAQDGNAPANNAAHCAGFAYSADGIAQNSPTFTIPYQTNADNSGDTYLMQFHEASLTAGTTCELAISANGAVLFVNIQANNVTGGTIQ